MNKSAEEKNEKSEPQEKKSEASPKSAPAFGTISTLTAAQLIDVLVRPEITYAACAY